MPLSIVQVEEPGHELVAGADAPAVVQRHAFLVDEVAVVVGGVAHQVDAQRRGLAGVDVEVADEAQEAVVADREVDLAGVVEEGLFRHLVDHAAGGAAAEQHRGRAAQQLDALETEHVAVVEGGVVQRVDVDVAGHREAAQPDVLLAAFGRQEADAAHQLERLVQRVDLAVVHQPFGDDGHRLRHVHDVLAALGDRRVGGAQRGGVGLGLGLHRDRLHRGFRPWRRCGCGRCGRYRRHGRLLRPGAGVSAGRSLPPWRPAAAAGVRPAAWVAGRGGGQGSIVWRGAARCSPVRWGHGLAAACWCMGERWGGSGGDRSQRVASGSLMKPTLVKPAPAASASVCATAR